MTPNREEDPFDRILLEIAGLIQLVKVSINQPPITTITPDIFAKMAKLERDVTEFFQITNDSAQRNAASNPQQMAMLEDGEPITRHDSRVIKKLEIYQNELQVLQKLLITKMAAEGASLSEQKAVKAPIEDRVSDKTKPDKTPPESRRGKFKPIGGNKKWLPL